MTFALRHIWQNHRTSNIEQLCLTYRVTLLLIVAPVSALSHCVKAAASVLSTNFSNCDPVLSGLLSKLLKSLTTSEQPKNSALHRSAVTLKLLKIY